MGFVNGITGNATDWHASKVLEKGKSQLGKDDFLKMLVAQLRYQDPMNPMEDKEFISQMAQFSALEQMQNMNASIVTSQAASMIGMKVSWRDSSGALIPGTVTGVKVLDGEPKLAVTVHDPAKTQVLLPMKDIVEISHP